MPMPAEMQSLFNEMVDIFIAEEVLTSVNTCLDTEGPSTVGFKENIESIDFIHISGDSERKEVSFASGDTELGKLTFASRGTDLGKLPFASRDTELVNLFCASGQTVSVVLRHDSGDTVPEELKLLSEDFSIFEVAAKSFFRKLSEGFSIPEVSEVKE